MLEVEQDFDLSPLAHTKPSSTTRPKRFNSQLPYLFSTLCILAAGLVASLAWSNYDRTQETVVLTRDLEAGQKLVPSDLELVRTKGLKARTEDLQLFVGETLNHDMGEGSVMLETDVATAARLEGDQAISGLTLNPGDAPSLGLAVGDLVQVVGSLSGAEPAILGSGEIRDVQNLDDGLVTYSLLSDVASANRYAGYSARGGEIRLVLLER